MAAQKPLKSAPTSSKGEASPRRKGEGESPTPRRKSESETEAQRRRSDGAASRRKGASAGSSAPNSTRAPRLSKNVLAGFALWRDAMRWQRGVDRAVRALGLTHTQLLVLAALERAFLRADDAVSQTVIAAEADLDPVTTSTVLRTLEQNGLVDRGITFGDKRAWRVILTSRAERLLETAAPLMEEASAEFFGSRKRA